MDYLYEQLGDERFQEFCSSLISKEFKDIQAFPTGQPDGGRDTIVYSMSSTSKEFIVFQVKYVKNANLQGDLHKWLTGIVEGEVEKINRLIERGAQKYYLITNVKGTAHLDAGSIDKVNSILESKINIPAICWWRDDITTLVNKDPLFKWSYPEILNGQDMLNSLLYKQLTAGEERLKSIVNSYLADQYNLDKEVKFKQVDLKNKLLELFTDVPIRLKKFDLNDEKLIKSIEQLSDEPLRALKLKASPGNIEIGAANFLTNNVIQKNIQRILLEGGPGQGKSTISQYITQVHRVKLLNHANDLKLLPNNIKKAAIRLPFKIDLRHIAAWIEKQNPYIGSLSDDYFTKNWISSLESFLVAHIQYHSKADTLNTDDLLRICKYSPVLFVFDGFDEIASINLREKVVDFINKGLSRLQANISSLQAIITSRPAAFSDSIGFDSNLYPHFELTDITPEITQEYIIKWIQANDLSERDASEILALAKDKLELPHIKELAKSPMQLAIFISLLRTRGVSLPNKRTALYDSYIDHFFNREAEKNLLVRDNRELIIDIHQYLAWVLHSEAELYKNGGSIHIDDLKRRLRAYLIQEGHDPDITEELFDVMKERVCALVSRVQGTFEFEVQPLREYFCAKFLYITSPHSAPGLEMQGTKPDRLNALLRNFYWQNVVRFFCGCIGKGEIHMLLHELRLLFDDRKMSATNYPVIITSQLLSDYVFNQSPFVMKDTVNILRDRLEKGNIINQAGRLSKDPLSLSPDCGGKELVEACFSILDKTKDKDYALEICGVINNNSYRKIELWEQYAWEKTGDELSKWLEYAHILNIIENINENLLLSKIVNEPSKLNERLDILIKDDCYQLISKSPILKERTLLRILNSDWNIFPSVTFKYSLELLTVSINHYLLNHLVEDSNNSGSLIRLINTAFSIPSFDHKELLNKTLDFAVVDETDKAIREFINDIRDILSSETSDLRSNPEHWEVFVESFRSAFGNSKSAYVIAIIASNVQSKTKINSEYRYLHSNEISLFKRVKFARESAGNISYWISVTKSDDEPFLKLLVILSLVTPKILIQLADRLKQLVELLDNSEVEALSLCLAKTAMNKKFKANQIFLIREKMNTINFAKIKYLILQRIPYKDRPLYCFQNFSTNEGLSETIDNYILDYYIETFISKPDNIDLLENLSKLYIALKGAKNIQPTNYLQKLYEDAAKKTIPLDIAKTILHDYNIYPKLIVALAEKSCRISVQKQTTPIGKIASDDKWFN